MNVLFPTPVFPIMIMTSQGAASKALIKEGSARLNKEEEEAGGGKEVH